MLHACGERVHSGCFRVGACTGTYSVVDGDERSVAMLPCLLSCCSLGEDGSESVISSISSWADWDLVFFLLNACLKELRNCEAGKKNKKQTQPGSISPASNVTARSGNITSCQIGRLRRALSKQSSLAGLSKEGGKKQAAIRGGEKR